MDRHTKKYMRILLAAALMAIALLIGSKAYMIWLLFQQH